MLKRRIVADKIKELLVVFLTDGENFDPKQTQVASDELKAVLEGIYSKFNVIGLGSSFNVQTLENLVKSGTQAGIVSSDIEKAFTKIYETFEQTPSAKIKIPGQAPIEVPLTFSDKDSVTFETNVILESNEETLKALIQANKEQLSA
jgi:hypothetical protein